MGKTRKEKKEFQEIADTHSGNGGIICASTPSSRARKMGPLSAMDKRFARGFEQKNPFSKRGNPNP